MEELQNSLFVDYNPYKIILSGSCLAYGQEHHVGEVYLNGKTLYEKFTLDEVKRLPDTPKFMTKLPGYWPISYALIPIKIWQRSMAG